MQNLNTRYACSSSRGQLRRYRMLLLHRSIKLNRYNQILGLTWVSVLLILERKKKPDFHSFTWLTLRSCTSHSLGTYMQRNVGIYSAVAIVCKVAQSKEEGIEHKSSRAKIGLLLLRPQKNQQNNCSKHLLGVRQVSCLICRPANLKSLFLSSRKLEEVFKNLAKLSWSS